MARKKGFNLSTAKVPAKAEYDDEELDFVKGKKIKVKSETVRSGASSRSKAYSFSSTARGKTYLHPPDRLIKGRVVYPVKYLGHLNVSEARGSKVVREAIEMVKVAAEVHKTNTPGWDIPDVDLSVSIRSIMCLKRGTKDVMHQHPINVISYSADDKRGGSNIFAYIVKPNPPSVKHICYVYKCTRGQAVELTTTIGEAFELAYKKFLEGKQAQEQFMNLKERLERASPEEKEELRKQLEANEAQNAVELARKKEAAEREAKVEAERIEQERVIYIQDSLSHIKVEGPPKYAEDHHEGDVAQDPKVANEKEAQATEVKSELEKQSTAGAW